MLSRDHVVRYFNELLSPGLFKDSTHNGLQVEGKDKIERIGFSVDSSLEIFRKAAERKCDMIVAHHGLIWGGLKKISGHHRERLAQLLKENMNLYISHLPLDKHPVIGNNACIVRELGGKVTGEIGEAGLVAELKRSVPFDRFLAAARELFGQDVRVLNYSEEKIAKIAVCSGSIPLSFVQESFDRGVSTVLTGEGMGESMFLYPAQENRMNIVFAGHTRTEIFGIQALSERFKKDFKERAEVFYL